MLPRTRCLTQSLVSVLMLEASFIKAELGRLWEKSEETRPGLVGGMIFTEPEESVWVSALFKPSAAAYMPLFHKVLHQEFSLSLYFHCPTGGKLHIYKTLISSHAFSFYIAQLYLAPPSQQHRVKILWNVDLSLDNPSSGAKRKNSYHN